MSDVPAFLEYLDSRPDVLPGPIGGAGYYLGNARHGWVPSDTPVHDEAAAEKHWQTWFALLEQTLKGVPRMPISSWIT